MLKLSYLLSAVRVDTTQKDHIYYTKQYQTFNRKIKCDLLNFRGTQNGYYQDTYYFIFSMKC